MDENKDVAEGDLVLNAEIHNKSADAYGNLVRGLTSEELAQTGTQKLILNDLSKAEAKIKELEPFREKYQNVLNEKCILDEKLSKTKRAEILYSFCITSGGIIVGLAKIFLEKDNTLAIIMLIIGVVLIIGGVLFKITYKK
ncbi:hypothetical protein OIU83_21300 [Flavobacterium sp. LS1R49]|uniref:DUF2335 domain-containing protein n=1 Tax=Flavobacterium shii TaxID=2987687 RepID=A0A9X3C5E7_9FLAO|nr:hypothetical protein [Flavobacterium shii]MCV9930209.1 hypothetical protein [Flavobacterium shii]